MAFAKQRDHSPGATACVEHGLAALELEPVEHLLSPGVVGQVGELVVRGRVPVDEAHSEVVTGPRSAAPESSNALIASAFWSVMPMSSSPWSRRCFVSA